MSLQVWLPLNGNLNNQGLYDNITIATTPTYITAGKIGQAMSTGGVTINTSSTTFFNGTGMSFAFWIKPIGTSGSSILMGQNSTSAGNNRMYSIFQYPTPNDLHLSWQAETSSGTFLSTVITGFFTADVWTHCCITYNGTQALIYKNGVLTATVSGTNTRTAFNYDFPIASSSIRYLNDVRIYDHCLSPKEVKEIAKGLVLHYKLDDQMSTSLTNKYSGETAAGLMSGSYTRTKLTDERGYNYTYNYTGTGSNSWPSLRCSNFSFTAGKKYYYSCKVRVHSANFSIYLRAARSDNDWVTNSVAIVSSSLADGEWHEYVVSQTVNSTYDRSGSTVTCNPILECYAQNLSTSGTVYSCNFDVKDIMVVESDVYVPFIDNTMVSSVMDCSGYGYNGTNSGTITWSSDTPRYSGSYYFNGSSRIIIPNPFSSGALINELTHTAWIKWNSSTGEGIHSLAYANGFFRFSLGKGNLMWSYGVISQADGTSTTAGLGQHGARSSLVDGAWYFIAVVFQNGVCKSYLNGELYGTYTNTSYPYLKVTTTSGAIGAYMSDGSEPAIGNISDSRLYATALSAADIKELYNAAASVDNAGNNYAYEFLEA